MVLFAIQCVIVFFIPVFFGWLVLRRTIDEESLVFLIPTSFILGSAAIVALVNELRFFLDFDSSLWLTYKILFFSSIVMLLINRKTDCNKSSYEINGWFKKMTIAAVILFILCYFGIPASKGLLNDAWWRHYPLAITIQNIDTFPLVDPFLPDIMLFYHYGPDILASAWSYLLNKPVQSGFALITTIFSPMIFLLAFYIVYRSSKNYTAAFLSGLFILIAGNLRFLFLIKDGMHSVDTALVALNSQTIEGFLEVAFIPSHVMGIALSLTALVIFDKFIYYPLWHRGVVFGILLGVLSIIAEWYFVLVFTACLLYIILQKNRVSLKKNILLIVSPFLISLFIAIMNSSYLSGYLIKYWFQKPYGYTKIHDRIENFYMQQFYTDTKVPLRDVSEPSIPPKPIIPRLLPVTLNTTDFGYVPTWEKAGSTGSNWVSIFSLKVLLESAPVVFLGLAFGIYLWYKKRNSMGLLLLCFGTISLIPPIFFKWEYRYVDILRFFTVSFVSFSILTGWLVGELLMKSGMKLRSTALLITAICLINPIALGIIGLIPKAMDTVVTVSSSERSISEVVGGEKEHTADTSGMEKIYEKLAIKAGGVLFKKTGGKERLIVMVPKELLPPNEYFPSWLKIMTFTRIPIPVGVYQKKSLYSELYEEVVTKLSPKAIAGLDAKWIYLSSQYINRLPKDVIEGLNDKNRFFLYAIFKNGKHWVKLYRIIENPEYRRHASI